MPEPSDILKSLHTSITDMANSYHRASELANLDAIGAFCTELKQAHMENAHAVAGALVKRGESPESDGSFKGLLDRVSLNVRFAVTADEKSVLPALRDAEKSLLQQYDDALSEMEIAGNKFTPAETELVRSQRKSVVDMTARIDDITRERMA